MSLCAEELRDIAKSLEVLERTQVEVGRVLGRVEVVDPESRDVIGWVFEDGDTTEWFFEAKVDGSSGIVTPKGLHSAALYVPNKITRGSFDDSE